MLDNKLQLIRNLVALTALIVLISACASKEEKKANADSTPRASQEAVYVANEQNTPYVTEHKFKPGGDVLSRTFKGELQRIYQEAMSHGKIESVKVIAWADLEYPAATTKKLSKEQIRLADKRGNEVKRYLHSLNSDLSVEIFNMAKRPRLISELLATDDARIKQALEVAGIPNTNTSVKVPSKAAHAIVMYLLKNE